MARLAGHRDSLEWSPSRIGPQPATPRERGKSQGPSGRAKIAPRILEGRWLPTSSAQISESLNGRVGREQLDALVPLVYDELRKLARSYLRRERPDHTLQPTALVHEAFERLVDQRLVAWEGRSHFLAIAAIAMRRLLLQHAETPQRRQARRRQADSDARRQRRRAARRREIDLAQILDLNECMQRLAELEPRHAELVELRIFAGMTMAECATPSRGVAAHGRARLADRVGMAAPRARAQRDRVSARYAAASELFLVACELPTSERPSYLDASCRGDAALRAEVEELLRFDVDPANIEPDAPPHEPLDPGALFAGATGSCRGSGAARRASCTARSTSACGRRSRSRCCARARRRGATSSRAR